MGELRARFHAALSGLVDSTAEYLALIHRSQSERFGDYQADLAMPLAKRLGKKPRDLAAQIVARLDVADLAEPPELAGPGFINLRLKDDYLVRRVNALIHDERLGAPTVETPRTFVLDYSAPNVAKPMHVGHIRSTVIGDALYRTLQFVGHRVISDNHIGDWGTQFGMILYGYRHFLDAEAYRRNPVAELARIYRVVRRLMDYHESKAALPAREAEAERRRAAVQELRARLASADEKTRPKVEKELRRAEAAPADAERDWQAAKALIAEVEADPQWSAWAAAHPDIGKAVLAETAKLHAGDAENLRLWREFLPHSRDEMERVYRRLGIRFDHTLGESFYHDQLPALTEELLRRGIARVSDGAVCIFFDDLPAPMIIRKQDGAFLYASTDLATLRWRMENWRPDAILYVVDHRQSLHFRQLFAAARMLGYRDVTLEHVSFGTVLGEDGRPFRTRAGDTVGLESLLDEAVRRAAEIVAANDDAKPQGPELSPEERRRVAEVVGIGALKYADLSQNRSSDYVFSYDKMLAMTGNTGTYMQYAYARIQNIFAKGGVDIAALRASGHAIRLTHPAERALILEILRFPEAVELVLEDYRPHQLTAYLFELANRFSTFYQECPVLQAPSPEVRAGRLLLCDVTGRVIRRGLQLLGIETVDRM
ncbi:MAG: arginine--tRNA ligase [Thermogutta sp.]|nr:arginine--tRNA ligase [Thermogutta sp.]